MVDLLSAGLAVGGVMSPTFQLIGGTGGWLERSVGRVVGGVTAAVFTAAVAASPGGWLECLAGRLVGAVAAAVFVSVGVASSSFAELGSESPSPMTSQGKFGAVVGRGLGELPKPMMSQGNSIACQLCARVPY